MKIQTIIFVYLRKYHWDDKGTYQVFNWKVPDDDSLTFVCEKEIEIEVPEGYDPTAQMIAALQAKKEKAMSDYNTMAMEIDIRISKLQALEYTA
jgi:hypothetical protein